MDEGQKTEITGKRSVRVSVCVCVCTQGCVGICERWKVGHGAYMCAKHQEHHVDPQGCCLLLLLYLSLFLSHIYRRLHVCPHVSSTRDEDRREIRDAIDVFLLVWTLLHSKCPFNRRFLVCGSLSLYTWSFLNPALTKGCISYHVLWSEQPALSVSQLLFHTLRNLGTWHWIYSEKGKFNSKPVYQWIHPFSVNTYPGFEGAWSYHSYCMVRVPEPIKLERTKKNKTIIKLWLPSAQLFLLCSKQRNARAEFGNMSRSLSRLVNGITLHA